MEGLLDAFFSFKEARNWRCKYPPHGGRHWQDEIVVVEDPVREAKRAAWLLHGERIASLEERGEGKLLLSLTDAGYPTLTTVSRLNAIASALRRAVQRAGAGVRVEVPLPTHPLWQPPGARVLCDQQPHVEARRRSTC